MSKQVFKNNKFGIAMRTLLVTTILSLIFSSVIFAAGGGRYDVKSWSFGVHGDTQWMGTANLEDNPNNVAVAMIEKLNEQMINKGVKFVIQPGDLTDEAGAAGLATRAEAAQVLYDQGIGFFPLRGNHETYGYLYGLDPLYNLNVPDFKSSFQQTQGGGAYLFGATNFSSPASTGDILKGLSYSFDYGDAGNNARFVVVDTEMTKVTHNIAPKNQTFTFKVGSSLSSYVTKTVTIEQGYFYLGWVVYKYSEDLVGKVAFYNASDTLPYAQGDYRRYSAVDGVIPANTYFRISSGNPSTNMYGYEATWPFADYVAKENDAPGGEFWPAAQQTWVSAQLDKATRGTEHAFVLSHRPMINENHTDCLFGSSTNVTPDAQNAFYASLANNNVKFMISAHDHLFNRALIESPDGLSQVMQIITQGASNKFYFPTRLDDFGKDGIAPNQTWVKDREIEIAQEVYNFGYYIYTVDGPRVTVDYYSDKTGNFVDGDGYPDGSGSLKVPNFDFIKKDEWGYSLNGKQFEISQGMSYTGIEDTFGTTTAKIIAGKNNSTTTDLTPVGLSTDGLQVSGPRALNKVVNTGWVDKSAKSKVFFTKYKRGQKYYMNLSDILSLWGMSELGKNGKTDTYVLSMSYDNNHTNYPFIGTFVGDRWKLAIDEIYGKGTKKLVFDKYQPKYGLGTYGIDEKTKTVWAVLDYNADFAVVEGYYFSGDDFDIK
jgi:hypothetical protein